MATKIVLNRTVTKEECDWLDQNLPQGTELYLYEGCTYGCISETGVAVTREPDTTPFFEVPTVAISYQ